MDEIEVTHYEVSHGRFKYIAYCFLKIIDGLIGILSLGEIQSIIADRFLLPDDEKDMLDDFNKNEFK